MNITDSTKNARNVRAVISEDEVLDLLVRTVAKEAGVDWCDDWCSGRAYYSSRDTSCGIKQDVIVEIEVDFSKMPTPA